MPSPARERARSRARFRRTSRSSCEYGGGKRTTPVDERKEQRAGADAGSDRADRQQAQDRCAPEDAEGVGDVAPELELFGRHGGLL